MALQPIAVGYVGPLGVLGPVLGIIDIALAIAVYQQDEQNISIKLTIKSKNHAFPLYPSPFYPFTISCHVTVVGGRVKV